VRFIFWVRCGGGSKFMYAANVDTILKALTGRGATVFIALLDDQSKRPVAANPPNPAEPAFPATTKADLALMAAHVRAYNDAIRGAAAKYGATTVNFYDTTIFTDAATIYGDGNHPNSAGYDRVAQIWFTAVQARLQ
jgi:lysophospholipase L1-like esterase